MEIDKYSVIGILAVPASIVFALGLSIGYITETWTVLSIFLSSIGIGLAIAIFGMQQSQNQKIENLTRKQHELIQKIDNILSQQQQNKNSRLRLVIPKIIAELKQLKTSYESLSIFPEHPKQEDLIQNIKMMSTNTNGSFRITTSNPNVILTTKYAENNMKKLFEDIQNDIDRILMENTIAHPFFAWEHSEFLRNNTENIDLITARFTGHNFLSQLRHCDFLIKYYDSLYNNIRNN